MPDVDLDRLKCRAKKAEAERDALAAKVAAVRALHVMHPDDCACDLRDEDGSCFLAGTCDGEASNPEWPCPTIKALEVDR